MPFDNIIYEQEEGSYTGETLGSVETTRALGAATLGNTTTTNTYVAATLGATTTTDAWIGS